MTPDRDKLKKLVNQTIDEREKFNLFNTSPIPFHTHNGTDSPIVAFSGILGISVFTTSGNLSNEIVVLVDVSVTPITLTLPNATGNFGRQFIIKDWRGNSSVRNITINTSLGQTIDGNSSKIINTNYASFYVVSDGSNWAVI